MGGSPAEQMETEVPLAPQRGGYGIVGVQDARGIKDAGGVRDAVGRILVPLPPARVGCYPQSPAHPSGNFPPPQWEKIPFLMAGPRPASPPPCKSYGVRY